MWHKKTLRRLILGILTILLVSFFASAKPESVNFLHYLIWKTATNVKSESGFIQNRGAIISYTSYGRGDPVLLLHGGLGNKLSWFSQLPWLVTAGRRVILIDTRGHGDSTHGNDRLSYQLFAEDTLKVLDKLQIRSTDIIGWSDGGITALLLGIESPDRVRRIVAISANFHPSGLISDSAPTQDIDTGSTRTNIKEFIREWWRKKNKYQLDLATELEELWKTAPHIKTSELNTIKNPTLVITGENDVIKLAHSGELAQMLPYGKIEIIIGAGHDALITHAEQVNALIASFLGIEIM